MAKDTNKKEYEDIVKQIKVALKDLKALNEDIKVKSIDYECLKRDIDKAKIELHNIIFVCGKNTERNAYLIEENQKIIANTTSVKDQLSQIENDFNNLILNRQETLKSLETKILELNKT